MAAPRALAIKISKLEKRIEALETLLEAELARGHMMAEKAPKAATKRRSRKKAT
jgi:hypothetical protein